MKKLIAGLILAAAVLITSSASAYCIIKVNTIPPNKRVVYVDNNCDGRWDLKSFEVWDGHGWLIVRQIHR